jgi:hypothetical protein
VFWETGAHKNVSRAGLPDSILKIPILGKLCMVLQWKMLLYYMAFGSTYIFCGYLVNFFAIIYGYLVYFSRLDMLYQEKSGNPDHDA